MTHSSLAALKTVGLATVLLSTTAMAQDLSGANAAALIKGKTLYQTVVPGATRPAGAAAFFYADDNTITAKFANGALAKGTWSVKGDTICVVWSDLPNNPCTLYRRDGDKITTFNAETGQPRGIITKIEAGNPEKL